MKSRLVKKAVPVNRHPLFPHKGPADRSWACFLTVMLLLPVFVQGTETDSFTDRYEPLPDILDVLDVEANRQLQLAVDETNVRKVRDIGLAESDGCDESPLYRAIYRQLGGLLVGRFESMVNDTAAEWGMIWKAVDDESLMSEAEQLAAGLARGPTIALGKIKQLVQQASANTLDEQLDLERDTQRELGRFDEYKEGVAAFLEKRPAVFSGGKG